MQKPIILNTHVDQRSREDWHVPDWALQAAHGYTELPDVGHVMMSETPESFGYTLPAIIGT